MTTPAIPERNESIRGTAGTNSASVQYSTLGAHALSFLVGMLVVLIGQNLVSGNATTFSTPSLISFLFGIALSAASTVLAIAAISLGKGSERVMIDRSDASIRLQNEVFTKTTEALARIESSTGVTEKRIEDIISGRAGELSHAIADRIEGAGGRPKPRAVLEREIKESLMDELSASRVLQLQQRSESRKKSENANREYRQFQNDLLVAVASSGIGNCTRLGDGNFRGSGDELFDAIVMVGPLRVGVSALSRDPIVGHLGSISPFVQAAAKEIAEKRVQRVVIVLDGEESQEAPFRKEVAANLSYLKPEIADSVILITAGAPKEAIKGVVDFLRSLHAGTTPLQLTSEPSPTKQGAA